MFSGVPFIQNGGVKCANEWNRTEISIDCFLARGQDFKVLPYIIFVLFSVQWKFSWKTEEVYRSSFYPE